MSHVRRSPSQQRRASLRKRQIKRKGLALLIILVIFLSLILSIVFFIISMP